MKLIIKLLTVVLLVSIILSCSKQDSMQTIPNQNNNELKDIFPIFKLSFKIAKPSTNCTEKWGLCEGHLIILGWHIFKSTNAQDCVVFGSGTIISSVQGYFFKATFKNLQPYPQDSNFEIASGDLILSDEISHAFGCDTLTLEGGTYNFYQNGDSISVNLPVLIN